MTKFSRRERSVTATLRQDGTVDLDLPRPSKPLGVRLLNWMLAGLWFLAGVVLIAVFAI